MSGAERWSGERDARTADYVRAQVRVDGVGGVDGRALLVVPRDDGVLVGEFPFGPATAYVLTAHDPGPVRLTPEENAARQQELEAGLRARGVAVWRAVAGAADGSHSEDSALVLGLDETEVLAVAAAWGQDAVFRWSAEEWAVVACDGAPTVHLSWEVTVVDWTS